MRFDQRLVLNQWLLSLFGEERFAAVAAWLKDDGLLGFDAENVTRFHHVLAARLPEDSRLTCDDLRAYDQNIVRHWKRITEPRNVLGNVLYPKYFQYLALLFTEIYLERYFRAPEALLDDLNAHVEAFNQGKEARDQVRPYTLDGLNKLAFWMATGAGKTLLMHVNILQFLHYQQRLGKRRDLNRIILLTPNEGLSLQHLEEFRLSRLEAELFDKDKAGAYKDGSIEIIDIHKLREEAREKTVAVDSFEGRNLVLVDEGHRGAGGVEWMDKRNRLCEQGFSFEYSATFGQAMKAANREDVTQTYVKCILFDYSYKYFYSDGYGKDFRILNLPDDTDEEHRTLYLTACLLAYYQQLKLFRDKQRDFARFLLHAPLWIFVGSKVTAVRTQRGRHVSDVVDILLFLADFARNRAGATERLETLRRGTPVLLNGRGQNIFDNAFTYIIKSRMDGPTLYADILATVFNTAPGATGGGSIHVEQLKGADGEIALRLGTSEEPFGVINVGDAPKLCRLCEQHAELVVEDRDFSGSLFQEINAPDSTIRILIGSKKFTEGWNSWRVATMGLMNIGRGEGSEIIQLFGRGVRLKGMDFCLKRSRELVDVKPPEHIEIVETLNIFGVRADYMHQFKEFLEEEGLPTNEDMETVLLPVVKNLGNRQLKVPKLKEGVDFKKLGPKPTLGAPTEYLRKRPVVLDWYPKVQAEVARGIRTPVDVAKKQEGRLKEEHLAFLDFDALYFDLVGFKNERAWHNLNLPREALHDLLADNSWYTLYIPEHELAFDRFSRVRRWQEIARALLLKYCDRYYKHMKDAFERPHLEYKVLTEDDPNFIEKEHYRVTVEKSREDIIETLTQLREDILADNLKDMSFNNFQSLIFERHLYQPLLHCTSDLIKVSPVPLNEGERDFVCDLRTFYTSNQDFFADGKELYLLRNQSKGRGIGFFEANNFYPDFILWLLHADMQHIAFIDPKGILRLEGLNDPKIQFHKTVKELEQQLGDPRVRLSSFIVSNTPLEKVKWWDQGQGRDAFTSRNVLFQKEDDGYVKVLLEKTVS